MRPWGHEEQTLTFLYAVHPTWEQTAEFSKCPTVPSLNKGSDKTDQDIKVGMLNEDRRMNTYSEQSESSPAGAREARFFLNIFLL